MAGRARAFLLVALGSLLAAPAALAQVSPGGEAMNAAHGDGITTARDWKAGAASLPEQNNSPDVLPAVNPDSLPEARLYDPRDDKALLGSGLSAGSSESYGVLRTGDSNRARIAPVELADIKARGEAINGDPQGEGDGLTADGSKGTCQEVASTTPAEQFYEASCNTGTKLIGRPESCPVSLDVAVAKRIYFRYIAAQSLTDTSSGALPAYAGFADELASGKCRSVRSVSYCDNLPRVGVAVPAGCAASPGYSAQELRCEGEAAGVAPTGTGYGTTRDLTTGQLWFAREEELAGVTATRNAGMCAPLAGNPDCVFEAETCTSSDPVTRIVDGFPITQPCWAWQRRYTCYTRVETSDCGSLAANPACTFQRRQCLDDQSSGPCSVYENIYRCPVPGSLGETDRQHVCSGDIYCLNGRCQEVEREASNELKDALIALGAMDRSEKEFDPANLSLFKGLRETCHLPVFGLVNCCAGKTSGLLSTASGAAALAGGPLAIAAIATPFLTMFLCSNAEKMLDVKDRMGLCAPLGSYCSARILGICTTKRKAYCCFESKLTRILQEQGRQQLNRPWGPPRTEQCLGFSVDEFARLDLSRMDFSEIYEEFLEAAKLPDEAEMAAEIQQKIRDYYASHAASSSPSPIPGPAP